jgi:hypothetical protein
MHTPRLHVRSEITGEGKTTVFDMIEHITPNCYREDGYTAVSIRNRAYEHPTATTFLLDEVDESSCFKDPAFRAVCNSGYRRSGKVSIGLPNGGTRVFRTFAPMGLSSVDRLWPGIERRSINIKVTKANREQLRKLVKFDIVNDPCQAELMNSIYVNLMAWSRTAYDQLNAWPEMPRELASDALDCWRVLVSLGDQCSDEIGSLAREASLAISREQPGNPKVQCLIDARKVFRTPLDELIVPAHKENEADPRLINNAQQLTNRTVHVNIMHINPAWETWEGPKKEHEPRPFKLGEMTSYLSGLGAGTVTAWPKGPRKGQKSARVFKWESIKKACTVYVDDEDDADETSAPTTPGALTKPGHWAQDLWQKATTGQSPPTPEVPRTSRTRIRRKKPIKPAKRKVRRSKGHRKPTKRRRA